MMGILYSHSQTVFALGRSPTVSPQREECASFYTLAFRATHFPSTRTRTRTGKSFFCPAPRRRRWQPDTRLLQAGAVIEKLPRVNPVLNSRNLRRKSSAQSCRHYSLRWRRELPCITIHLPAAPTTTDEVAMLITSPYCSAPPFLVRSLVLPLGAPSLG